MMYVDSKGVCHLTPPKPITHFFRAVVGPEKMLVAGLTVNIGMSEVTSESLDEFLCIIEPLWSSRLMIKTTEKVMIFDPCQQTTALFISEGAASKAARIIERNHPDRVSSAQAMRHRHRGELLGYKVMIHFTDGRPSTPLTNSDFERLS